jgi:hypothetical protein
MSQNPEMKQMLIYEKPEQLKINNGDSSFGATKIFHEIDIPNEIRARSRKFKIFYETG